MMFPAQCGTVSKFKPSKKGKWVAWDFLLMFSSTTDAHEIGYILQ